MDAADASGAGVTAPPVLTDEMRAATKELHSVADNLVNLKLLVALTDKQLYGRALLLFYYIYAQLEVSIRAAKDHQAMQDLHTMLGEFARSDKIAKDLQFFLGADWSAAFPPTAAVTTYVNHLKELEKKDPTLLVPYCYHMYIALLAGGQMIRKMVKKSFDVTDEQGLNTFAFQAKSKMALRGAFKDKINAVPHDDATKALMLAESVRCFKMNNEVVRSLDGTGRQLQRWVLKWIVVLGLIYAAWAFFVRTK